MTNCKRVLLKVSGEAFLGSKDCGIDYESVSGIALQIAELRNNRIDVIVVMGGGNLFRGIQQGSSLRLERTLADQVGMLATVMNGIVLKAALERLNCETVLISALECPSIAETFQWEKARRYLKDENVLLCAGGTGNPYFTTDTAAALRACELNADIFLKATSHVDAIYDKDPRKYNDAKRFDRISYRDVLEMKLGILDLTAVALCMTNQIPIRVFNLKAGSLFEVITNTKIGSLISEEKNYGRS